MTRKHHGARKRHGGSSKSAWVEPHHHHQQQHHAHPDKQQEEEAVNLVNQALNTQDYTKLRQVCSVFGLAHHGLREKVWGQLIGAGSFRTQDYEHWASIQHRDAHVVKVDTDRSLFGFLAGCSPEELQERQQQLQRLLNAVVGRYCTLDAVSTASASPSNSSEGDELKQDETSKVSGSTQSSAAGGAGTASSSSIKRRSGALACLGACATISPDSSSNDLQAAHSSQPPVRDASTGVSSASTHPAAADAGPGSSSFLSGSDDHVIPGSQSRGSAQVSQQHQEADDQQPSPSTCQETAAQAVQLVLSPRADERQSAPESSNQLLTVQLKLHVSPVHSTLLEPGVASTSSQQLGAGLTTHTGGAGASAAAYTGVEGSLEEEEEEEEAGRAGPSSAQPSGPKPVSQDVFYYQGLHDIASVLLLVCGSEAAAFPLLSQLVKCQLRDATRTSLAPVMEVLNCLYPLLTCLDPPLAAHFQDAGLPPFFALSWLITWFAHDVKELHVIARLFDLFMSSHPLMPLYLGAALMIRERNRLINTTEMPELHTSLVNLKLVPDSAQQQGSSSPEPAGQLNQTVPQAVDDLIKHACRLLSSYPPERLIKQHRLRLTESVMPVAKLQGDMWTVPDRPPHAHLGTHANKLNALQQMLRFIRQMTSRGRVAPGGDQAGGSGMSRQGSLGAFGGPRSGPLLKTALSITSVVGVYLIAALITYANTSRSAGERLGL